MIIDKVIELLADQLDMNKNEINENTTFEDLGVDSLDAVEITMEMEDEFGVELKPTEVGTSVKELVACINAKLA